MVGNIWFLKYKFASLGYNSEFNRNAKNFNLVILIKCDFHDHLFDDKFYNSFIQSILCCLPFSKRHYKYKIFHFTIHATIKLYLNDDNFFEGEYHL